MCCTSSPALLFCIAGNVDAFHTWTGAEYKDTNITDIGTQTFPNMELLSNISPERILLSPRQTRLGQRLQDIAPITIIQSYPYVSNRSDSLWTEVVKKSVASDKIIQATCFSGFKSDGYLELPLRVKRCAICVQLRVLPLQRAGLAARAA